MMDGKHYNNISQKTVNVCWKNLLSLGRRQRCEAQQCNIIVLFRRRQN